MIPAYCKVTFTDARRLCARTSSRHKPDQQDPAPLFGLCEKISRAFVHAAAFLVYTHRGQHSRQKAAEGSNCGVLLFSAMHVTNVHQCGTLDSSTVCGCHGAQRFG